ncbi:MULTISPECIES: hypothetical protein [unclassified Pseudoalteromonas]|uniref:hypothetical protein n=1 Tax=unclassified Pseudoalteromonas TaxID=194690 RepID=UPI0005AA7EA5|nr:MULTISPECIES: hypothetical protein [unclassified Pseudoalteromonas]
MAASLLWFIQHTMKQGQKNKFITFFSGLFSPYNYQFMFVVFAVSTPIILAFERQKQDAKMP